MQTNKYLFLFSIFSIQFLSIIIAINCQNVTKKLISNDLEHDELKILFLLHRHGERSPWILYPNDPYNEQIQNKIGIGQLINSGKERLYKLGQYLAKYYFDSGRIKNHSPKNIYVQSSDSVRCLQSVSLLLAGMFPPENDSKWNDNLGQIWQPLPIHTRPFKQDMFLNPNYICPAALNELAEIYKSKKVVDYGKHYQTFLMQLSNWTGYPADMMNIVRAAYVYDILLSEKNCGFLPPKWASEEVMEKLNSINNHVFLFNSTSEKIQRFITGSVLNEMVSHMNNHYNGQLNDNPQIYIYSTHDTWLTAFLIALNSYNNIPPSFGATIMLEVYGKKNAKNSSILINQHEWYLKGYYLNDTLSEQVNPLPLNNCDHKRCTLSKFQKSIQHLMAKPEELERDCYLQIRSI